MKDHLPEWKRIKSRYEESTQTPEIKYRISRIEELIKSEEIREKELNHFR